MLQRVDPLQSVGPHHAVVVLHPLVVDVDVHLLLVVVVALHHPAAVVLLPVVEAGLERAGVGPRDVVEDLHQRRGVGPRQGGEGIQHPRLVAIVHVKFYGFAVSQRPVICRMYCTFIIQHCTLMYFLFFCSTLNFLQQKIQRTEFAAFL